MVATSSEINGVDFSVRYDGTNSLGDEFSCIHEKSGGK